LNIVSAVMAGLVPAIHVLATKKGVDALHESGHDELEVSFVVVCER
jgi:hypothetical protein